MGILKEAYEFVKEEEKQRIQEEILKRSPFYIPANSGPIKIKLLDTELSALDQYKFVHNFHDKPQNTCPICSGVK